MSLVNSFPLELLSHICASVFFAAQPPEPPSLDPLIVINEHSTTKAPTGLPSFHPPAAWPEYVTRKTLSSLCLVNRRFHNAAKPWLWAKIEVRLPQNWLSLIDAIVGPLEEEDQAAEGAVEEVIRQVADVALVRQSNSHAPHLADPTALRDSVMACISQPPPDNSIPLELLSPPASREPSPRRLRERAKSPGRWRLIRDISTAIQEAISLTSPGVYVQTHHDPRPGRHIQHLDFNHFRTIGMRRSMEEGVSNRFVTSDRLYRILQEMPNLLAFGATEYMDGALSFSVLVELLFRGRHLQRQRRSRSSSQQSLVPSPPESDDDDWARRRECIPVVALDLCGCVSAVFIEALTEVVEYYLGGDLDNQESHRGRRHNNPTDCVTFPGLRRLGLRGARSITATVLEPFVLSFPNLTHLDLSGTRCTPNLLHALGASTSVRLIALSLGRCPSLTASSIEWLLVRGRATFSLKHFSVYGDVTFPSPLSEVELEHIVTQAPCLTSGRMEYLDISSCPMTLAVLQRFCPQPALRSLGLSYIPHLALSTISDFISKSCCNLEIITLVGTSPELLGPARQVSLALHQTAITPLSKPPYTFSLTTSPLLNSPPTSLRVIELSTTALGALGVGSDGWRVVRSKGGRGWYVDSSSGWCAESSGGASLRRSLPQDHPARKEIASLADACGNVGSSIGWHARKMEVLLGSGMLGREDGLYGAVSFAYSS